MARRRAKPDEWMPWFIADYRRDTAHLSPVQDLAYRRLLEDMWVKGGELDDDDRSLAVIARMTERDWKTNRPVIARFFQIDASKWTQKRLAEELATAQRLLQQRVSAAHASVAAKRQRALQRPLNERLHERSSATANSAEHLIPDSSLRSESTVTPEPSVRPPIRPLTLDADMLAWIADNTPWVTDPASTLSAFEDWKSAHGRRHKDARAAFRNWCRKAREFQASGPRTPLGNLFEGAARALAERALDRREDREPLEPLPDKR